VRVWPSDGLWRHPDFLKLWSAETISQFGSQISLLALPLVAIDVLHATAFQVAALSVVEFLPFLLVSLPAGVWVDRLRRRPILVAGDVGRAALLASIPIAHALDALTLGQLYAVGFFVGISTVFFDVAYQSYLPSLVERAQLVEGNSKLEISRSSAQIGGPGIAGVLVDWLTAPAAVLFDAVSFAGSALFIFGIRKAEAAAAHGGTTQRRRMRDELSEGLRYVLGHPYLKNIAASTAAFNFFGMLQFALLIVFARRVLHLSPAAIGLAFMFSNVGPLIAAFSSNRIAGRFGAGPTIIGAAMLGGPMFVLVPFAPHGNAALAVLAPAFLVGGFMGVLYNVTQLSLRQAITPERIQGRMNSVMRFIVWGTIPLGSLTGGVLASATNLKLALVVGGVGCTLSFLPVLFSPVREVREIEPLLADV
jgi:MFS family permease